MSLAQGNKHTDPAEDRNRVSRSGIRRSGSGDPGSILGLLVRQQLSGYNIHSHTGTSFQRQPAFTIAITLLKCNELYTYLPQLDIEVAQLKRNETTFFRRPLGGNWFFDDTIGIQMCEHPKILASRKCQGELCNQKRNISDI